MNSKLKHGASGHGLDEEGSLMSDKTFETPGASSSFSVDKAVRRGGAGQGGAQWIPRWLRDWRTPRRCCA